MNTKNTCAIILGSGFLAIFILLIIPHVVSSPATIPVVAPAGIAIWKDRTYDTMLQGIILLAGIMSILLLLGRKQSGRMPP